MKRLSRVLAPLAAAFTVMFGVTACAPAMEAIAVTSDTVIIDVRTPGEFASGNRSTAAIDRMEILGFTSVANAGGVDAASSATGIAIVK